MNVKQKSVSGTGLSECKAKIKVKDEVVIGTLLDQILYF